MKQTGACEDSLYTACVRVRTLRAKKYTPQQPERSNSRLGGSGTCATGVSSRVKAKSVGGKERNNQLLLAKCSDRVPEEERAPRKAECLATRVGSHWKLNPRVHAYEPRCRNDKVIQNPRVLSISLEEGILKVDYKRCGSERKRQAQCRTFEEHSGGVETA
jgi:hypothetical protein